MNIAESGDQTRREALHNALRVIGILLFVGICIALASYLGVRSQLSGSKTQLAESFFLAILPLLLYLALLRPFIFPFALFIVLVPIDNLLGVNSLYSNAAVGSTQHVATITKYFGLASGLAFILWLVRNRRYVKPPTAAILWSALLVWMALSVFWALDSRAALEHLTTYAELIILLLVISIMPLTAAEFRVFVGAVVLGALIAAGYSIYQYHAGGGVIHGDINVLTLHSHLKGAAEIDPNALTAALLLPIAIVVTAFLKHRWSLAKLGLGIVLAILLGGVFVTASRGGLIALIALLTYLLVRSRYRMQVFGLMSVALVASFARGMSNGSIWSRFADAAKTGGSGRTSIWRVGWDAFKHHWLLGAGVGNFPTAYDQSYIRIFEFYNQGWHRVSHNTPLGVAVELGVVGVVVGAIAAYTHFRMLRFIGTSDPLYDFRIGLESAFVGLFIASIFLWVLPGKYTWQTLELLAATRAFALCRSAIWQPARSHPPIRLTHDDMQPRPPLKVPLNV